MSVLVVEDHPDAAESTAELLALLGCRTRVAGSGDEALAAVAAEAPDVILLDIGLPGVDGWEVARRVRAGATGRGPVIVAVTGRGTDSDRRRSADAGIDLHLVKPAAPDDLVLLVARIRGLLEATE
ncbi:response regulator [Gemmata sp.]|uniref:response regulator n=1 Tax=Gemmata sp. TaxID=1914242 RepID=UPI003F7058EF